MGPTGSRERAEPTGSIFDGSYEFPVMVVHQAALEQNIATMATFTRHHGLDFAPHAKTHLSPEIAGLQLDAGAWGLTVATPAQARIARSFGPRRLLLANQLVDPAGLAWARNELERDPAFEFLSFVDSAAGVRLLAESAGGRPYRVLVELGHQGGRAGSRTLDDLLALADLVRRTPGVELAGVAGYEGSLTTAPDVLAYLGLLAQAVEHLRLRTPYLSVGGSQWFDVIARELAATPARVLLRSGAYVSHDDGYYRERTPFTRIDGELRPALEVWAHVLSTPEPGLAVVGMGKRDAPYDEGLPIPRRPGVEVLRMQDQHTLVRGDLQVGDLLSFGVSHPCTAFDKWRELPLVTPDYQVVGTIRSLL